MVIYYYLFIEPVKPTNVSLHQGRQVRLSDVCARRRRVHRRQVQHQRVCRRYNDQDVREEEEEEGQFQRGRQCQDGGRNRAQGQDRGRGQGRVRGRVRGQGQGQDQAQDQERIYLQVPRVQ